MTAPTRNVAQQHDVLTLDEVAKWLKLSARQVLRYDVPRIDLGHKTKRFLARDVLAWLEAQRRVAQAIGPKSNMTNAKRGGSQ